MSSRHLRIHGRSMLYGGVAVLALSAAAAAKDLPRERRRRQHDHELFRDLHRQGRHGAGLHGQTGRLGLSGLDRHRRFDRAARGDGRELRPRDRGHFKAFEQDDGAWRIEQADLPPIKGQTKQDDKTLETTMTTTGFKNVMVLDPALGWIRSGDTAIDKMAVQVHGPGVDQTIDMGPLKATSTGKAAADGALAAEIQETIGAFALTMAVDPKIATPKSIADAKPVNVAANAEGLGADVKFGGVKMKTVLDLWAFLVAHPGRPELAANEAALKTLLSAALANPAAIDESVDMKKLTVLGAQGPIALEGVKIGIAGAATGPTSYFEERFAATSLALPATIVPAMFHDLVPTSFDIGFKLSGFNLTAAGAEAIANMHLAGDGPAISKEDNDKVLAKLLSAGPLIVDIPSSHIVAPQLDIAFEGQVKYTPGGKPTGTITVHMRDFDKTVNAVKGLGPDTEKQMVPALAMAKGLAKTDPDGALSWVGEIGADGVMKVNGLPLGKAPF